MTETLEGVAALREAGLPVAGVVANQVTGDRLGGQGGRPGRPRPGPGAAGRGRGGGRGQAGRGGARDPGRGGPRPPAPGHAGAPPARELRDGLDGLPVVELPFLAGGAGGPDEVRALAPTWPRPRPGRRAARPTPAPAGGRGRGGRGMTRRAATGGRARGRESPLAELAAVGADRRLLRVGGCGEDLDRGGGGAVGGRGGAADLRAHHRPGATARPGARPRPALQHAQAGPAKGLPARGRAASTR